MSNLSYTTTNVNGLGMKVSQYGDGQDAAVNSKYWKEFQVCSGLQIRDTANHNYQIDATEIKGAKVAMCFNSGMDQTVYFAIYGAPSDGAFWTKINSIAINGNVMGMIGPNESRNMLAPFPLLRIQLYCTTAPTTGSVSVYLEGVDA